MVNILVSASEIANNKDLARTYSMISSFMLECTAQVRYVFSLSRYATVVDSGQFCFPGKPMFMYFRVLMVLFNFLKIFKADFVPMVMPPASLNQAVHQSSLNKLTIREDRTMLYHIHYY
ncbi:hypothetical protein T12_5600 [Trichinella patagoniensis]|uniref:Uncharacterized protein n=1 Tax=Trichinella patagoniensis TaxID=990121 RepID=A0A0V1A8C8_9BILA|nr:hypothetical protein T12_2041 [Trichinella patagoniensis]KRY20718.1 hypothetical protein T12_5600 [Trichinella patagoniensis]